MSNLYAPTCQFRQLGCNKNNALIYKLHILHVIDVTDVTLRHFKTLRFICLQISPQINSNIRNIYNLQTWHVRICENVRRICRCLRLECQTVGHTGSEARCQWDLNAQRWRRTRFTLTLPGRFRKVQVKGSALNHIADSFFSILFRFIYFIILIYNYMSLYFPIGYGSSMFILWS